MLTILCALVALLIHIFVVSPFFPFHCAFQDLKTGRTVGDESESKGLHFFNSVQHTLSLIVTVVREKIGELGDKRSRFRAGINLECCWGLFWQY